MNKHQYATGFNAFMNQYRTQFIKEFFIGKKIDSLADIGCGPGDIIIALDQTSSIIKKIKKITTVDFNQEYLKKVKKKYKNNPKFHYICSPVENLKLDQKYDLIIMIDILEHLEDPLKILKKIKKYLSSHGYIISIVPNAKSLHRRIGKQMKYIKNLYELGVADFKVGHKRYFDSNKLVSLIKKADYNIVSKSGILLKPLPNNQMQKLSEQYCDALYEIGKELPDYCGELAVVFSNKIN